MKAKADKDKKGFKKIIILIIVMILLWIWWENTPLPYVPRKDSVDISIMGEEAPVKIITLNSYITAEENPEIAYLLGDKGNLYVLCCDTKGYFVDLWHPKFWKDIEIVDICAERPGLYAAALDSEGRVYIWDKEYAVEYVAGEIEPEKIIYKREDWKIYQLEDELNVKEIYSAHDQFVIVTEMGNVYRWYPGKNLIAAEEGTVRRYPYQEENVDPSIDEMEVIETDTPILNIAASEETLFILDENNDLWGMTNGMKSLLKENVKSIVQGQKGLAIQTWDNENEIYIHNIDLLQKGYKTEMFADQYEVAKIVFEDKVTSMAINSGMAVVCTDRQEFYRWGRKRVSYRHIAVPSINVYENPVKIDLEGVKYYMIIGDGIVYLDEKNELFVYRFIEKY